QFIKASVVSRRLRASGATELLVHTGQHFDQNMSDVFFTELGIPQPDFHLGVSGGNHGEQTGRMLERVEQVLIDTAPDWVLVYGDTNSTLAGALAAAKRHLPIAHVEAGLRSFNRRMPEEINRVLTDHLATVLFAPTDTAVENLRREGLADRTHLVGDVMYDCAIEYGRVVDARTTQLSAMALRPGEYVLATIHRQENTDSLERLSAILSALATVARDVAVVLPLHPRTRRFVAEHGLADLLAPLRVIDPVGYLDMVMLERGARLIATDSGGVQKEAYFHGVPCVTLRDETEWVELVTAGWNRLAPPTCASAVLQALRDGLTSRPPAQSGELYGGGQASARVVDALLTVPRG
ncbi:MAG TPA: UDP-N-acetylglucosamine 2-epimerase (non-hydrolyzing), partial [Gemmatimonadaceae bacterium]|nr:UDP-N-acetylglucosamine 2-epimerase (non-hydrolyzing) [Gemmatimonadaceae bacterium]